MICALVLIVSLATCGTKDKAEVSADTGLVGSRDYAELSGIVYTFNADGETP